MLFNNNLMDLGEGGASPLSARLSLPSRNRRIGVVNVEILFQQARVDLDFFHLFVDILAIPPEDLRASPVKRKRDEERVTGQPSQALHDTEHSSHLSLRHSKET